MNPTDEITRINQTLVQAYQDRIANLRADLSVPALDGTPFMIVATIEHRTASGYHELELVYGSFDKFDKFARYDENAKPTFRSLEIIQDHLCGVSLFDLSKAQEIARATATEPEAFINDGWTLKGVTTRHILDEKTRRLQRSEQTLKFLLHQQQTPVPAIAIASSAHTDGPWIRRRDIDNSPDIHILAEDGALIATVSAMVSFNPVTRDSEEMKANARLIAAAPELLEALEGAEELAEGAIKLLRQLDMETGRIAAECVLRDARAAIAKAKGGAL